MNWRRGEEMDEVLVDPGLSLLSCQQSRDC